MFGCCLVWELSGWNVWSWRDCFCPLDWSVQGISGFPAGRLVRETINMDAPGWMMFIKCLGQLIVSRFGCWLVFCGNNSGIRLRGWICIYSGFILSYDKTVMISILNYYEPCSCFLSSCVASWMWWLIFCHQTMLVYIYISFYSLPKYCVRSGWLPSLSDTPPMAESLPGVETWKPGSLGVSEAPDDGAQLIIVISGEVRRPLAETWGNSHFGHEHDMGRGSARKPINHEGWISARWFFLFLLKAW